MNRPIKFRAWHKKEKRFVEFEFIPGGWCLEEDELDWKQLEPWQQFTGLTDKNGKEIYEGDIVFTKWNEEFVGRDDGSTEVVFWCNKNGGWATSKNGKEGKMNSHLVFHCFPKHTKVIGNVFENPELLNT